MGKVDFRRLSENERQELWRFFERMLSDLQTSSAIGAFLADMLTPSERVMVGRRVRIAQLLLAGFPQDEICKKLGVGLTTVQSVDRWLRKDAPDYRSVFSPLYAQLQKEKKIRGELPMTGSFTSLRKKYPVHFLLFNMLLDS